MAFNDGGAGGTFSNGNLVVTDNLGTAVELYTLSGVAGTVTIRAAANGVTTPAFFSEVAQ